MNHEGTTAQSRRRIAPIPAGRSEAASIVVDAAFTDHPYLGQGLLESVFEQCRSHELTGRGLQFQRRVVLPIRVLVPL
jgi:hypothetical protein